MTFRVFRALVQSKTAITDLLSTRLYSNTIPQGTQKPMGYFRAVSAPRTYTFDGIDDLQDNTLDVFLYAETATELENLLNVFETELTNQSGTYNGVVIYDTRIIGGGATEYSEDHKAHVGTMEIKIIIRKQ